MTYVYYGTHGDGDLLGFRQGHVAMLYSISFRHTRAIEMVNGQEACRGSEGSQCVPSQAPTAS
jgi:hypothetical protein